MKSINCAITQAAVIVIFSLLMFNSCSSGGEEGGGGLFGDLLAPIPDPGYPLNEKLKGIAKARVTQPGFQFIEERGVDILEAAMGGSLTFAIPPTDITLCTICDGSPPECNATLDIQSISFALVEPNLIQVTIVTDLLSVAVPDKATAVWVVA